MAEDASGRLNGCHGPARTLGSLNVACLARGICEGVSEMSHPKKELRAITNADTSVGSIFKDSSLLSPEDGVLEKACDPWRLTGSTMWPERSALSPGVGTRAFRP